MRWEPFTGPEAEWLELIVKFRGHPFQTLQWAHVKSAQGWRPYPLILLDGRAVAALTLVLERRGPMPFLTVAQIPFGPAFAPGMEQQLGEQVPVLVRDIARARRHLVLKWHPDFHAQSKWTPDSPGIAAANFTPSPHLAAYRYTFEVQLRGDEEDGLFQSMDGRGRTGVRKAQASGLRVEKSSDATGFAAFRELYLTSYVRSKAIALPESVLTAALERVVAEGLGQVFLTRDSENRALAAAFVLTAGTRSVYVWGGTIGDREALRRNPGQILHWEVMRHLNQHGVESYDLGGVTPGADADSKRHGIYLFKSSFGGQQVDQGGTWDYNRIPHAGRAAEYAMKLRNQVRSLLKRGGVSHS